MGNENVCRMLFVVYRAWGVVRSPLSLQTSLALALECTLRRTLGERETRFRLFLGWSEIFGNFALLRGGFLVLCL